jgi:hypothetical protein
VGVIGLDDVDHGFLWTEENYRGDLWWLLKLFQYPVDV